MTFGSKHFIQHMTMTKSSAVTFSGPLLPPLQVLVPECTEGTTFDCLYCDASLSEEDLPMFLSLLKPCGRMVVMIDDEAVLVTRGGGDDAHDFVREVMAHVGGDFGELEDPTSWEVQEAIRRIKERERRRGAEQVGSSTVPVTPYPYSCLPRFDLSPRIMVSQSFSGSLSPDPLLRDRLALRATCQAKSEVTNLRSYEYVEMEQRVRAAMQRISELESIVQRDPGMMRGSPLRSSLGPGGGGGGGGSFGVVGERSGSGGSLGPFGSDRAAALLQQGSGLSNGSLAGGERSPMGRMDDVRVSVKDKSLRRGMRGQSPRSSIGRMGSTPDT